MQTLCLGHYPYALDDIFNHSCNPYKPEINWGNFDLPGLLTRCDVKFKIIQGKGKSCLLFYNYIAFITFPLKMTLNFSRRANL